MSRQQKSDASSLNLTSLLFLLFGTDEQELAEPGSESSSESSSDEEQEDAHHYADTQEKEKGLFGRIFSKLSVNGLTERMLRKTVRKNTWIYVADMDGNRSSSLFFVPSRVRDEGS